MVRSKHSLLYCLSPIVNLSLFFGVLPCRIVTADGNRKLEIRISDLLYSIFFCLFLAAFFQWAVVEMIQMETWKQLELIASLAAFGQIYGLFVEALIGMITSWLNRWRSADIINRIDMVDQQLGEMDIALDYKRTKRKLIIELIGLSIVPIGASMVNCFVINSKGTISFLCYVFICFLPIVTITLKEFQYFNSVLLIRQKIHLINRKLLSLGEVSVCEAQGESSLIRSNSLSSIHPIVVKCQSIEYRARTLENVTKIHAELMDILKEIQGIFGPHLLVSILIAFGIITTQLYYMITGLVHELHYNVLMIYMTTIWVGIQFLLILINVVVCSKTRDTVRDLLGIFERVANPSL